jgi:hypothetical protein
VGPDYRWMLSRGVVDERQLLLAALALERARGDTSPLAPWLDALPCE